MVRTGPLSGLGRHTGSDPCGREFGTGGRTVGESLGALDDCTAVWVRQSVPDVAATGAAKQSELPLAHVAGYCPQHHVGMGCDEPLGFGHRSAPPVTAPVH